MKQIKRCLVCILKFKSKFPSKFCSKDCMKKWYKLSNEQQTILLNGVHEQ